MAFYCYRRKEKPLKKSGQQKLCLFKIFKRFLKGKLIGLVKNKKISVQNVHKLQ